ncbi:Scopoletin glucosyltransferase [Spatholobus suberectus]|nr:Scopoletin glucosyltransferase [Spatholobus suberectus]
MGSDHRPLHTFFFPFLAHGHIIPTVDMAKLFAAKGIKATIITTPLKASLISRAIGKTETYSNGIHIQPIKFPSVKVGLPEGCENVDSLPSPKSFPIFFKATRVLQEPLEQLLLDQHPDCLIADPFHTWVADSAAKLRIPRIVFQGVSVFTLCSLDCIKLYEPHYKVSSDSEYFAIPGEIGMTRNQLPDSLVVHQKSINLTKFYDEMRESEARSYGIIVNSFYELGQVFADYYWDIFKRKAWHIGPMFLCAKEKAQRGNEATNSSGKGLIIRGWAPQVLILEHEAVGAFVTHCGWNSTLEGAAAGVPMVTMPVAAEQFFNEKLVTEVLKIGVPVGVKKWVRLVGDSTKSDAVEKAVKRIMAGEEADQMRNKVEEGGSSYSQLYTLIEELGSLRR